jgi:hypothetical protein
MKMLLTLIPLVVATAALAQPDLPRPSSAPAASDAERIVCEVRADTSSRLNRRRVCMTEAKWAQYRREVRDLTDRAQVPYGPR